MEYFNKDKTLYRILSGQVRIIIKDEIFLVCSISPEEKYIAEELYDKLVEEYCYDLMSEDELLYYLLDNNLWSLEEEEKIGKINEDIKDFQVKLFESQFQGNERKKIKDLIKLARQKLKFYNDKRHQFDSLSIKGAALIEKNKYIIGLGVCNSKGQRLFTNFDFYKHSFSLLDRIIIEFNKQAIHSTEYRLMARTEPWRQYWTAKDLGNLFNKSISEFTDEQLMLISWSKLYDSVYQHQKCPSDDVIDDDDCLDGFLIKDKQERDKERGVSDESYTKNEKIRNAHEVFIVAETEKDIKKVNAKNTDHAMAIRKLRDKTIYEKGNVNETDLPDVKKRLQEEMAVASMKAAKR